MLPITMAPQDISDALPIITAFGEQSIQFATYHIPDTINSIADNSGPFFITTEHGPFIKMVGSTLLRNAGPRTSLTPKETLYIALLRPVPARLLDIDTSGSVPITQHNARIKFSFIPGLIFPDITLDYEKTLPAGSMQMQPVDRPIRPLPRKQHVQSPPQLAGSFIKKAASWLGFFDESSKGTKRSREDEDEEYDDCCCRPTTRRRLFY